MNSGYIIKLLVVLLSCQGSFSTDTTVILPGHHLSEVQVNQGDDVLFVCHGTDPVLRVGENIYEDDASGAVQQTITVTSNDHQTVASCATSNSTTNVSLNVEFLMLNDKTTYDVIVGEEQAVEIDFSANPRGSVILPAVYITKNGEEVQHSYFLFDSGSNTKGKIILHFLEVTEEDLGQYEIKQHFSPNAVNISLREVSSPLDLRLVFIYISPVLSLLICLIVIIIAVCYVRKQKN